MRTSISAAGAVFLLSAFSHAQTIQPSSVPISTRDSWCSSQIASCPLLCLQQTNSGSTRDNTCDPKTLDWVCVCVDGTTPNVSEYSQTVPYYECQEWGNQCVAGCGQDNACASNCRQQHPCGAQDPTRVNSTSSSSMSQTATATGSAAASSGFSTFGGSGSGSGSGSSGSSSGKSGASAIINLGQSYGLGAIALGLFGGFVLLL